MLSLAVLALAQAAPVPAGMLGRPAPKPGMPGMTPIAKGSADAMEMGKLREAMLSWYCAAEKGHSDVMPCTTYVFMKKMRETKDPTAKKAMLTDRQAALKGRTPEEAKAAGMKARTAYKDMFGSFCEANKDHDACSHPLLKKLYGTPTPPGGVKDLGGR